MSHSRCVVVLTVVLATGLVPLTPAVEQPVGSVSVEQTEQGRRPAAGVLASFDGAASPRLRELLAGLIGHLHSFAREVRLTEAAVGLLGACEPDVRMIDERMLSGLTAQGRRELCRGLLRCAEGLETLLTDNGTKPPPT